MKYLFLDFDGVLNSHIYMGSPEYVEAVKGMDDWEIIQKAHHTHLDPKALELVDQIVDSTDAVVIASTTWRLRYSINEMNIMLANRGARFKILGATPAIRMFGSKRGDEIRRYLEESLDEPESFVIIDDIDFFTDYPDLIPYFVKTEEMYGIRKMDVGKAIKIFNKE